MPELATPSARESLFPDRGEGRPGLVLFLNAGDPSFDLLRHLVLLLDDHGVDCLELAVPFPNVVTDGAVIRRSAQRALERGADLAATLSFVEELRPELRHLRIVLMADWRHTVRALRMDDFVDRVHGAGCDGLLLHGVPPRARPGYYESAGRAGLPIVTTCFVNSSPAVMEEAARNASAYLYLVSHFGRGGSGSPDPARLAPALAALRPMTEAPIAVGFGVNSGADVHAVWEAGADAGIVGSACVACLERTLMAGCDPIAGMRRFLDGVHPPPRDL